MVASYFSGLHHTTLEWEGEIPQIRGVGFNNWWIIFPPSTCTDLTIITRVIQVVSIRHAAYAGGIKVTSDELVV